jgi:hypothetical protein
MKQTAWGLRCFASYAKSILSAASASGTEGQDGKPTTEQLQDGVTEPTQRSGRGTVRAPAQRVGERRALPSTAHQPPSTSIDARDAIALSLAPVLADAAQRMAAKEAAVIAGYAKHIREGHPEQFEKRAAEFYARHAEHVQQAFEPGLWGLRSQILAAVREEFRDSGGGDFQLSDDSAAGAYAKKLGDTHVEAGKAALAEIMTGTRGADGGQWTVDGNSPSTVHQPPSTLSAVADAIEARGKGLASAIADTMPHAIRQASNYFARNSYRAAGCTHLRWVADPADPEECRALDGQVAAIDGTFSSDPPRQHPPLAAGCRCGIAGLGNVVDLDNRADGKGGEARNAPTFPG